MTDLLYDVSGHVATITLNRPGRKNAFTLEMVDEWAARLREAQADPVVRAVLLTGAGDAFCAGVDLDAFAERERTPLAEKRLLDERVHQVAFAAEALSKPYVAAVGGVAVGAGMDMSLMCDIRLAGSSARFSEGYVRVGLVPGDGGCYYLPRIVGTAKALDLLWTGRFVNAAEALEMGLVSAVHADEELPAAAREYVERLAAMPPIAVSMIKRSVRDAQRHELRAALDLISSHQAVVTSTDDSREAMQAFREKRQPVYSGR
ncbi:enoyl-CoA hydratase/isomerase family protein [Actinomadura rugatobispora]|uniref:Enoyl-CoA hydratase/isomerase family protein n=1 Tax=Actinomadura rugatobispora TaxID=1994 RepID=A0ABW0ZV87_9ACTN|nr:enoyl-CoA hydratase-related protein [Actinomadura rugatobispora]